jgi:transposase
LYIAVARTPYATQFRRTGARFEVIALFAEKVRPEPRPVADEAALALGELVARRRQLVEMIKRQVRDPRLRARISEHLDWLQSSLNELDGEIGALVRRSSAWRETDDLLQSVPGAGPVVASALIAELPELASLGRRQIASRCVEIP